MRWWIMVGSGLGAVGGVALAIAASVARTGPAPSPDRERFVLREVAHAVAVDPERTDVIYAGGDRGLFASEDAGSRWRRPSSVRGAQVFEIVHASPKILYAATSRGLYRSDDGGGEWSRCYAGRAGESPVVRAVAVDSANADLVWIGTGQGIRRSPDGGRTWETTEGVQAAIVHAIAHGLDPAERVWVVTATGLYRSDDQGRSWTRLAAESWSEEDVPPDGTETTETVEITESVEGGSVAVDRATPRRIAAAHCPPPQIL